MDYSLHKLLFRDLDEIRAIDLQPIDLTLDLRDINLLPALTILLPDPIPLPTALKDLNPLPPPGQYIRMHNPLLLLSL